MNTTKVVEEYFMDGQINQGGAVSNHRSWIDQPPGLTQQQAEDITAARKSETHVSKQSEVQKEQDVWWVHRLVLVLLLLLVLSPLLVGSLLVGWRCLVVIKVRYRW